MFLGFYKCFWDPGPIELISERGDEILLEKQI